MPSLPFVDALNTLTQNLIDVGKSGLMEQQVLTILKLADQIRSIAQAAEQVHSQVQETLPDKLTTQEQRSSLQTNQALLLQIITHAKGEGHSTYSVKKLSSDLNQWRSQFDKLQKQAEVAATQQALQAECQQLHQQAQALQHQAIGSPLEDQRKLDLLRHLIELEKNLEAIERELQSGKRDGLEDRQKLDKVKQAIEEIRLTYGWMGG